MGVQFYRILSHVLFWRMFLSSVYPLHTVKKKQLEFAAVFSIMENRLLIISCFPWNKRKPAAERYTDG